MKPTRKDEADILATLDRYSRAYAKHDLVGILGLFAQDSDVVLIGTGADEKRIGFEEVKAQFERNFGETETSTIAWRWHKVSILREMAWVAADAAIEVIVQGRKTQFPIRMTIVLERRDGSWLWVHRHASVPAPSQVTGTAYPTQK